MPRQRTVLKPPSERIVIGQDGIRLYQAIVTRSGLRACMKGLRLNTMYTPTNCLRTASLFTGVSYRPRGGKTELQRAIDDITKVIDAAKAEQRPQQGTEQQPWANPIPETPMPDGPQ